MAPLVAAFAALSMTLSVALPAAAQDGASVDAGHIVITSPDGLVTAYVPADALPPGVDVAILQRSLAQGPREIRSLTSRSVLYRFTPRSATLDAPVTIVRRYDSAALDLGQEGTPVIALAIKGSGGWAWLADQWAFSIDPLSAVTASGETDLRARAAERIRTTLGIPDDVFVDPFSDPGTDLVITGSADRLGDLIGLGGGIFVTRSGDLAGGGPGSRVASRGQTAVSRSFGGRTNELDVSVDVPRVADVVERALYPDRSFTSLFECRADGKAVVVTDLMMDRVGRQLSLFRSGPLAALDGGAAMTIQMLDPVVCG